LKSIIKEQRQTTSDDFLHEEIRRLQDENDKLRVENAMLKRKFDMDDSIEDDLLIKRSKTDTDVFNSLIEFSDSLPGDDIPNP
jgi:regulator of replication initiation timing